MKSRFHKISRILSVIVSISLMLSLLPNFNLTKAADTDNRKVDANTMNGWTQFFGEQMINTTYAGGVWVDKTVLLGNKGELPSAVTMKDDQNNFLVALSAIASSKSISGYSQSPTDTVFVLDVSGSMTNNSNTVPNMVSATNDAIATLLSSNPHNRISIVLYSGNNSSSAEDSAKSMVLLPLDRYIGQKTTVGGVEKTAYINQTKSGTTYTISTNRQLKVEGAGSNFSVVSRNVTGGTFIQHGLWTAHQQFQNATTVTGTGVARTPVMVLMTDGDPTYGTTSYDNVKAANTTIFGTGGSTNNRLGFVTQLTASYVRDQMQAHYKTTPKFFTLGLGVSSSDNEVALSVLDPANSNTDTIKGYWSDFAKKSNGAELTLSENWSSTKITVNSSVTNSEYVDKYFNASQASDLSSAFKDIVSAIESGVYFPTMTEDGKLDMSGFISFNDEIGEYMEVKDIKGLVLGDAFFSGVTLASVLNDTQDGLGTVQSPTDLGTAFLTALKDRLGITDDDTARQLINNAYSMGQLYYDQDSQAFSNYIGWYTDADGKYVDFWHEGHTKQQIDQMVSEKNATNIVRSYGFLGELGEDSAQNNMLHIFVQVNTNISTNRSSVVFRIPAALIPLVVYKTDFKGDDLATATDATLERIGADPIRLVYEVGMTEGIDELNVAEVMADAGLKHKGLNGEYYFYSNRWGNEINGEIDLTDAHSKLATTAVFTPSLENERYYYTEDSTVYIKNGDNSYTPFEGAAFSDTDTYYHPRYVFEKDTSSTKENAAKITPIYEIIYNNPDPNAQDTLKLAKQHSGKNTWYIPKGSVHDNINDLGIMKLPNETQTIPYSSYPVTDNSGTHTIMGVLLGNNGRYTVTSLQGIRLSKSIDATDTGVNTEFTFDIALTPPEGVTLNNQYPLYYYENGVKQQTTVAVTNNAAKVTVAANQTVYITDLPTGTQYVITEQPHKDYVLNSINGAEGINRADGVIKLNTLDNISFQNNLITTGNLIIEKLTENIPANTTVSVNDIEFTATVTLKKDGALIEDTTLQTDDATQPTVTVHNGVFNIKISSGEKITVKGIPKDVTYEISEINMPNGFTLDQSAGDLTGTIVRNQTVSATLVNNYTSGPVQNVNVTLKGSKTLEGRQWLQNEKFIFDLYRITTGGRVLIGTKEIVESDPNFDFSDILAAEKAIYTKADDYYYELIERNTGAGGMTYDETERSFLIKVEDRDIDGYLETRAVCSDIENMQNMTVTADSYDITTFFTNKYKADGEKITDVQIQKHITNNTGVDISLSGFEFGLYDLNGNLIKTSTFTDNQGKASLLLTYDENDIGTHKYVLKEKTPKESEKIRGMVYSMQSYNVTVVVKDNYDGTISATIQQNDGVAGSVISVDFTNKFHLSSANFTLTANKQLEGRLLKDGEFTFDMFTADKDFNISGQPKQTVNAENGSISFDPLTFDRVGNYYFVVKENADTKLDGITYDENEYYVTVNVKQGENADLVAEITSIKDKSGNTAQKIEFKNTYVPEKTSVTLKAVKTVDVINGEYTLTADSFEFVLKDEFGVPVKTAKNDAYGNISFDLEFLKAGTYIYTLSEKSDNAKNITYDKNVYDIEIEVIDDYNGFLSATVSCYLNYQLLQNDLMAFKNTYNEPIIPPPTTTPTTTPTTQPTTTLPTSVTTIPTTLLTTTESTTTEPTPTEPTTTETTTSLTTTQPTITQYTTTQTPTPKPTQKPTQKPTDKPEHDNPFTGANGNWWMWVSFVILFNITVVTAIPVKSKAKNE